MPSSHQKPAPAVAPDSRPRLLVVDDSRVIRRAIAKILGPHFELVEMEDGEAAWEALTADETIQAVISDVEMPRLDGHGLLKRIRAAETPRVREIPVIIVTGAEDEPAKQRAFDSGATDFITKPIDGVQLLARARTHARLGQTAQALAKTETALQEQTITDPLTRLYNRRFFLDRLAQAFAHAQRHQADLAVIRLDIDHFKTLFTEHGDQAADAVLVRIADMLRVKVRKEELAARIGGAEFAVLAPTANRVEGLVLAERLRAAAQAEVFEHAGKKIPLSASLGLVTRVDADDPEVLLATAQKRLNRAKAAGGNRIEVGKIAPPPVATAPAAPATGEADNAPEPQAQAEAAPDIAEALRMITEGEEARLEPYLAGLTLQVLPLLETCNSQLGLGLRFAIESLKEKLVEKRRGQ